VVWNSIVFAISVAKMISRRWYKLNCCLNILVSVAFTLDRRPGRLSLGAGLEPMLHLLHHELYVASIPKASISRVSHSLLQLLLGLFGDPEGRR